MLLAALGSGHVLNGAADGAALVKVEVAVEDEAAVIQDFKISRWSRLALSHANAQSLHSTV